MSPVERVYHPDGRSFSLRLEGHTLRITKGKGSAMFDVVEAEQIPTGSVGGLERARETMQERLRALPSVYTPEPAPPILGLLDRARELARKVARLDEIEAEAVELRAWIEGAMS